MTKPLEEHIAELQATMNGPSGRYWSFTPAVSALIAALEQAQEKFKRLDERNSTLNSTLDRWAVERAESANTIAELESQNLTTSNALLDAGKKIAELEASQLAVKLTHHAIPLDAATAIRACMDEFPEAVRDVVEECAVIAEKTIRAAGGVIQEGE